MITDPIADLLTRIRNGQMARHHAVKVRKSNMAARFLTVLAEEGFIESFEEVQEGKFPEFNVVLKYFSNGNPAIRKARRYSRPGVRAFRGRDEIPQVQSGLGLTVVSTSQGVLSDREARKRGIGGEVLAMISC